MNRVIANSKMLAIGSTVAIDPLSVPVDIYKTYGTPHGLFIPINATGYQFIRWVRKGFPKDFPRHDCSLTFIHVDNDGDVFVGDADGGNDHIVLIPYTSEKFSLFSNTRDVSEAYSHLFKKLTTISQAIALIEGKDLVGMPEPQILLTDEWMKYAEDMGWNKTFWKTSFTGGK